MIKTVRYERIPFEVDAIRITDNNFHDVARWCGGNVITILEDGVEKKCIKVRVRRRINIRQTRGFVGDWILRSNGGFMVYLDAAFSDCFQPVVDDDPES